jgi:RimJ/RimL family protein N-acetyltransferase
MRTLPTERLTLEPQVAVHAEEMFEVLRDPAIYRYENDPPASLEWLRSRFARLETRRSADGREQWLNWVLRLRGSGLVGYVQATVRPDRSAAIAYVLGSTWWGRGLAQEAVRAMLPELTASYGVRDFHAILKRENLPSRRLLERLGFAVGSVDAHREHEVPRDEMLMQRIAGGA